MNRREQNRRDRHAALDAYRAAAHAEADAHFDERALEAQRHKILDRLATLGQTAKVIRFPVAPREALPASAVSRRWISLAAAAGLIIGLVTGQFFHVLTPSRDSYRQVTTARSQMQPAGVSMVSDDGLLGEVDSAVQLRSAAALQALDELTFLTEPR